MVRVLVEAMRLLRRADHAERAFADESDRSAFQAQARLLRELAEPVEEYLDEVRGTLLASLEAAPRERQADWLRALTDLRADTAPVVRALLDPPSKVIEPRFRGHLRSGYRDLR